MIRTRGVWRALRSNVRYESAFKVSKDIEDFDSVASFFKELNEGKRQAKLDGELSDAEMKGFQSRVEDLKDIDLRDLRRVFYHPSAVRDNEKNNNSLSLMGDKLLAFIIAETLATNYPNLPAKAVHDAFCAYTSNQRLFNISQQMGIPELVVWKPPKSKSNEDGRKFVGITRVSGDALEATLALLYMKGGMEQAKQFVFRYIMPEQSEQELLKYLKVRVPMQTLDSVLLSLGKERADYEIIGSSGVLSHNSVFTARVTSKDEELAVGQGPSKKLAKHFAARNALNAHWAKRVDTQLYP